MTNLTGRMIIGLILVAGLAVLLAACGGQAR